MRRNSLLITISPGVRGSLDEHRDRRLSRPWIPVLGPVLAILVIVGVWLLNVYWLGQ